MLFSNLEALLALEKHGTISRAAAFLGLTQSAVSKKIKALELDLGHKLTEPSGRRVVLTSFGTRLLEKAKPHYYDLKDAFSEEVHDTKGELLISMSGSLLVSWGSRILKNIKKDLPNIILNIGSFQTEVAVSNVRSGNSMIAIVYGSDATAPDLDALHIAGEELVIVPSNLTPFPFPKNDKLTLLSVENISITWSSMERRVRRICKTREVEITFNSKMQTFSAVAQLARSGFGHGLVPISVALTLGIPKEKLIHFPRPGATIPISLIGRQTTLKRSNVELLYKTIMKHAT